MAYGKCFVDKAEFNRRFGAYIKREWILMEEDNREAVLAFMERHPVFIAKPLDGCCGRGVEKLTVADYGGAEGCYEHILSFGVQYELEELLIQHPAVSAVYPHAINTVRTVTVNHEGQVHLICTYFRIGNGGKHVDNFNNGGMVAPVDETTGIVKDRSIDKQKNLYADHPMTGTAIKGFQFPDWEEAMQLAMQAATEVPQMGYIGWDVAFTEKGPCLVEGNDFPGHDIYQLPQHTPDKIGMMEKFSFLNKP
jgi:glutathione synthase/RimK-type ligase-like ATP-grasp enzyme